MSWQLWRVLNYPLTGHPLYQWARARRYENFFVTLIRIRVARWLRPFLHGLLFVLAIPLSLFGLVLFIYFLFILAPLAVPIANNIYCAFYASNVSSAIVQEREHKRYELLCVSPNGKLGAHWVLGNAWLHHSGMFRNLFYTTLYFSFCVMLTGMAAMLLFLIAPENDTLVAAWMIGAGGYFFIDFVQSMTTATLVAMVIPIYAQSRANGGIWALGMFLLLQIAAYIFALIAAMTVIPALLGGSAGLIADLATPLLSLGLLYGLREGVIIGLWRLFIETTNAHVNTPRELALAGIK